MTRIEATRARNEFSETLNQVAYGRSRVVVRRHGRDVAALVPMSDLQALIECLDGHDRGRKRHTARRRANGSPRSRRSR